jgi:hypothetical protein
MHCGKLEIKFDLTQKKSPFLMTFLFAPLIGGMLQPFSIVDLDKNKKQ